MTPLEDAMNDHLHRLSAVRFCGIQEASAAKPAYALFNDAPEPLGTGSSFAVHPGETIGEALDRLKKRYANVQSST